MPTIVTISGTLAQGQKLAHTVGVRFSLGRDATQAEAVKGDEATAALSADVLELS